jgi:hypothetical protein
MQRVLRGNQALVHTVLLKQLGVGSAFDNFSVIDYEDLIRLDHGRKAVCDGYCGSVGSGGIEGCLNDALRAVAAAKSATAS